MIEWPTNQQDKHPVVLVHDIPDDFQAPRSGEEGFHPLYEIFVCPQIALAGLRSKLPYTDFRNNGHGDG